MLLKDSVYYWEELLFLLSNIKLTIDYGYTTQAKDKAKPWHGI